MLGWTAKTRRCIGDVCPIDIVGSDRAAEAGYGFKLTDEQINRLLTTEAEGGKFCVKVKIEVNDL